MLVVLAVVSGCKTQGHSNDNKSNINEQDIITIQKYNRNYYGDYDSYVIGNNNQQTNGVVSVRINTKASACKKDNPIYNISWLKNNIDNFERQIVSGVIGVQDATYNCYSLISKDGKEDVYILINNKIYDCAGNFIKECNKNIRNLEVEFIISELYFATFTPPTHQTIVTQGGIITE